MTEEDVSDDDTKVIFFGPDSFESIFLKANVYNLLKYSLWKKIFTFYMTNVVSVS